MRSLTTPDFWIAFASLPPDIKSRVLVAHRLWDHNPRHPSLHFKKIGNVWSVRIGAGYRALAVLDGDTYYWFWVGGHDAYERLLGSV